MENYTKGESRTVYDPPQLHIDGAVEMKVTNASKIRNIVGYAMSSITDNNIRHITWTGSGNAVSKTISCVEILKRKVKEGIKVLCLNDGQTSEAASSDVESNMTGLHQITQIGFLRVEDLWESTIEGLDTLKVNKNIPAISILLSKDPLDSNDPSYQAPGARNVVWAGVSKHRKQTGLKKNFAAVKDLKSAASKPKWNKREKKDGSKVSEKQTSKRKSQDES